MVMVILGLLLLLLLLRSGVARRRCAAHCVAADTAAGSRRGSRRERHAVVSRGGHWISGRLRLWCQRSDGGLMRRRGGTVEVHVDLEPGLPAAGRAAFSRAQTTQRRRIEVHLARPVVSLLRSPIPMMLDASPKHHERRREALLLRSNCKCTLYCALVLVSHVRTWVVPYVPLSLSLSLSRLTATRALSTEMRVRPTTLLVWRCDECAHHSSFDAGTKPIKKWTSEIRDQYLWSGTVNSSSSEIRSCGLLWTFGAFFHGQKSSLKNY